jgi:hypothetical protein
MISNGRAGVDEAPIQYDEYSESASDNPSYPKSSRSNSLFSPPSSRSTASSIYLHHASWSVPISNGIQVAPLLLHEVLRPREGPSTIYGKVIALQ